MFFRIFTADNIDAIREAINRQTREGTRFEEGISYYGDGPNEIIIDRPGLTKVVATDSQINAEDVERTLLDADRHGWVPLYLHQDFREFADHSLEPHPDGFVSPFRFDPGHVEDVEFTMK